MIVKKLLESLQGLASVIETAGAKKHAQGLENLKGLFEGQEHRDTDEAIADLRKLLDDEKQRARGDYLKRLVDAKTDEAAFKSVHGELGRDPTISKEDADEIAHSYTGGRKKWATRKASLDAIQKKFVERAYQESKMKIVERYKIG